MYDLDLIEQVAELIEEENQSKIVKLRNKATRALEVFAWLTPQMIANASPSKLQKWINRQWKVERCGEFVTYFEPASGGYKSYKMVCEDFTACSKCAAAKAEAESQALKQAAKLEGTMFKTVIQKEDYDTLRNSYRGKDGKIMRRYSQSDGTVVVFTNESVNSESKQIDDRVNISHILGSIMNLEHGSRISGSVKSAPIVNRKAQQEEPDQETPEPELESEEQNDLLALADILESKDENESATVYHKLYHLETDCTNEVKKDIIYNALRTTYLNTYKLNPDLHEVQYSINVRQDAYIKNFAEECESRNISYVYTFITKITRIKRKNVDWKNYFKQFILEQFDLEEELGQYFT